MKFVDYIEENEFIGREGLKDLVDLGLFPKYDIYYTNPSCVYDAYFINKKRVFIEIKCRYQTYGEYILEYKKVRNIKEVINDLYLDRKDIYILYLNFCPEATYLWNITDYFYDKVDWSKRDFNEATFKSREKKKNKDHIMLKTEDSKIIKYKINKNYLIKKYEDKYLPKKEIKPGIFD